MVFNRFTRLSILPMTVKPLKLELMGLHNMKSKTIPPILMVRLSMAFKSWMTNNHFLEHQNSKVLWSSLQMVQIRLVGIPMQMPLMQFRQVTTPFTVLVWAGKLMKNIFPQ